MELVLVERSFDQPMSFEDVQKLEDEGSWCFDAYKVRFLKTLCSRDRRRMLCLYEAPDAEAVRLAEDRARVPYDRIWTCSRLQSNASIVHVAAKEYVVVEREFPSPVTAEFFSDAFKRATWCLDLHRATYVESYLGGNGMKMGLPLSGAGCGSRPYGEQPDRGALHGSVDGHHSPRRSYVGSTMTDPPPGPPTAQPNLWAPT
jgi:hypothetical protein